MLSISDFELFNNNLLEKEFHNNKVLAHNKEQEIKNKINEFLSKNKFIKADAFLNKNKDVVSGDFASSIVDLIGNSKKSFDLLALKDKV